MLESTWATIVTCLMLAAPVMLAIGKLFYLANSLDRITTLDDRIANLQKELYHIIEADDTFVQEVGPGAEVKILPPPAYNQVQHQPIKPRRNINHA